MFRREGPARDPKTNTILAAYLAATAGFVNSGGFVMIGSFTSHVTGSVGRLANDIAEAHFASSLSALLLVVAFGAGAVIASLILEQPLLRLPTRYASAFALEALLLLCFVFSAGLSRSTHPRILDAQAAFLCCSMGMQNSMVTRLSGAVVRTTHLTGVLTDLGIEVARWLRWRQASLLTGSRSVAASGVERPSSSRAFMLGAIIVSFMLGAGLGAAFTLRISRWAMCVPAAAIALAAAFAFRQGSARDSVA